MKKLVNEIYDIAYKANRYLRHVSDDGLREWERIYLRRIFEIEAADGSYLVYVEALWPENIKWLRQQGFRVIGDDDEGYTISWGKEKYFYEE